MVTKIELICTDKSYLIGTNAYQKWWENNKYRNFNEFKYIDRLILEVHLI